MRKAVGTLLAIVLLVSPANAQQPTLVVENGRVITGDGAVLEEASVVVAGDSILSVTREPVEAPDARRFDASGKTVLPGLIDAHVHLTSPPERRDSTALIEHLEERVPGILGGFLQHGVTTIRSTGDYWPWIGEVRDSLAAGDLSGPRLVTAGPIFTAEGGHPAATVCAGSRGSDAAPNPFCRSHLAAEVASPREASDAVRRLARQGVDFIKLAYHPLSSLPDIEDDVVAATVDQAHQEGLRAVGHVADTEVMQRYAEMGLDGFVHPPILAHVESRTDAQVRRTARILAEHGTPVTTTLIGESFHIYEGLEMEAILDGTSPYLIFLES